MPLYIYLNGTQRGPFGEKEVRAYLRDGLLTASDLAATQPEGHLQPIPILLDPEPASPPVAASPPPTSPSPIHTLPSLPVAGLGPDAPATLAPNETPSYRTSLHWIVFVRFLFLTLCVFLLIAMPFAIAIQALTGSQLGWFALPLPAFIMIAPTLAYVSSELVITNVRVLIKTGIMRRQTLEMFISKIESIAIDQSFLGRIMDYGTVVIRGTGGLEERFEAIARPVQFRNCVQRMQGGPSHPRSG